MYGTEKLRYSISLMIPKLRSKSLKGEGKREILSFAPHRIVIYEDLLKTLSSDEKYMVCNLENVLEKKRKDKINILLRHDIDTAECIENMSLLLEKDLKHQFIPSVYLRVDGKAYDLRRWRNAIDEYHRMGIPFGLHSVCYIHDRYFEIFREETRRFIDETGVTPKSFTLHGLGEHGLKNRMEFISKAKRAAKENGYSMTDCSKNYISYDYVIHDSHWDEISQNRYIWDEFVGIRGFSEGRFYLLLTHPCYWEN